MDAVVRGLRARRGRVGKARLRAAAHRLEHAEMVTRTRSPVLARTGVIASVQPAFDAAWGGAEGMYVDRLGAGPRRGR